MKLINKRTAILLSATAILGFSNLALADEPAPLNRVEGVIVHNTSSASNISFVEGERTSCERTSGGLDVTRCALSGSSARISSNSNITANISFDKLSYFSSPSGNKIVKQYIYVGVWTITQNGKTVSSPVALTLLQYSDTDSRELRGYISIEDYNIREQVKGTIQQ